MNHTIAWLVLAVCCAAPSFTLAQQKPNSTASKVGVGQATENPKVKVGVTDSAYDDIGSVLRSLGVEFQLTAGSSTPLVDFNCLFVGCTTSEGGKFPAKELRDYVERGGVLYVSDLAYPILQQAFPDMVPNFERAGQVGAFKCNVLDPKLAKEVGEELTLNFDATGWASPTQVSKNVQVLLALQQPGKRVPVLITFKLGRGKVVYTSFHNHANANALEMKLIRSLVETPLVAARAIQGELRSGSDPKDLEKLAQGAKAAAPAVKLTPQGVAKMSPTDLLSALDGTSAASQELVLAELHDRKGGEATLALGEAVAKVDDALKDAARDLLVKRLSRLTAKNLTAYLASDAHLEVRIAAAKAAASKNDPDLTGQLIIVLQDVNARDLADAAHATLFKTTNQDFGPFLGARTEQRVVTATKWKTWWMDQKR